MRTAEEVLCYIIDLFTSYLEELADVWEDKDDFAYGEKTAYTECLEIVQCWKDAEKHGLGFEIEKRFPLVRTVK